METEMHRAFDEADADESIKVIILTGAGAAFCAGYNMEPTREGRNNLDPTGRSVSGYLAFWSRHDGARLGKWDHMWRIGKPIIAAVNGWAMGAGFWYQLAADITLASDRAVFAQPEVRHISNSSFLFTALCGWKAANRWSLTGDHFDAREAYRIGLVNDVVSHDRLMEKVFALARRMSFLPEPSLRLNKQIAMQGLMAAGVHSALQLEGTLSALAHASHDPHRERLLRIQREQGLRAFLDARDGPFHPEPMGPRSARERKAVSRKR
jgi:enoyl-CoA hydratase/carnithine racemase